MCQTPFPEASTGKGSGVNHNGDGSKKPDVTPGQKDVIALAVGRELDRRIDELLDPASDSDLLARLLAPGGRFEAIIDSTVRSIKTQTLEALSQPEHLAPLAQAVGGLIRNDLEQQVQRAQKRVRAAHDGADGGDGANHGNGGEGNGGEGNGSGGDDGASPDRNGGRSGGRANGGRRSATMQRLIDDVSNDPRTFLSELVGVLDRSLDVYDKHADARLSREGKRNNPFAILGDLSKTEMGQAAIGYYAPNPLAGEVPSMLSQAYMRGMGAKVEAQRLWQNESPSSTPTGSSPTQPPASSGPSATAPETRSGPSVATAAPMAGGAETSGARQGPRRMADELGA